MRQNLVYKMMGDVTSYPDDYSYVVEILDRSKDITHKIIGDYEYDVQGLPLFGTVRTLLEDSRYINTNDLKFYNSIIPNFSDNKFVVSENRCKKSYIINNIIRKTSKLQLEGDNVHIKLYKILNDKIISMLDYIIIDIIEDYIEFEDDYGDRSTVEI